MTHCMPLTSRRLRLVSVATIAAGIALCSGAAMADFRLCNKTGSRIGVSIGYKEKDIWSTEGWWNVAANSCETLLRGQLGSRFYYVYAIDYDRGGEWNGKAYMCTRDKEFTINGIEDCLARGYDRSGFFEIDTGEQRNWTVQLTEPTAKAAQTAPAAPPPSVTGAAPAPASPNATSAGIEPGATVR